MALLLQAENWHITAQLPTSAPLPIPLATVQPKAIILIFFKLNQQVVIFYLQFFARGDAASRKNSNFQSNSQQYAVVEQATEVLHRYRCQNKQNLNSQNQL